MSSEENKRIVRRFYEAIDRGDLDAMDEFVAEDYVDHNPPPFPGLPKGREGLNKFSESFENRLQAIIGSRIKSPRATRSLRA